MMLNQATEYLDDGDAVCIRYRFDGSLFNLRSLQAHTKTLELLVQDLPFPNDAAIFAYCEQALQRAIVILLRRGSPTPWARGLVEED